MNNRQVLLVVISLMNIVLSTTHVTHDIISGVDTWGPHTLIAVLVLGIWLYATLVLPHRRAGLVIIFLGGVFAAGMPVLHSRGNYAHMSGAFLFIWILFALGATGLVSMILAVQCWPRGRGLMGE